MQRRLIIFFIVSAAFALTLFERLSLAAIAGPLMAQYQLNAAQLGSLGSSFFYIYALMQIPVGIILDRWGARRLLTLLLAIAAAGSFLFALAPHYGWLLLGRALTGVGFCAAFISGLKLLSSWFPPKDLALWNGLFLAVSDAGMLLAGRPLVEASQRIGWSAVFVVAGALTALTAGAVWLWVRDEPAEIGLPAVNLRPPAPRRSVLRDLLEIARLPLVWLMGAAFFCLSGIQISFQAVWAGPYLTDVYGLAPAVVGNLLMLIPIGQVAGNLVLGGIADRLLRSRSLTTVLGVALYAALWIPLGIAAAGFSRAGLVLLYGGGFGFLWSAVMLAYPIMRERFPVQQANTATGAVNLLSIMGGAMLQQLFGALINRFPRAGSVYPSAAYQLAFSLGLALACVGFFVLAAGILWQPARRPVEERA
jgi:sugar phosphate permease